MCSNLAAQVQELFYWHSFPRFAGHVDDHQDVEVLKACVDASEAEWTMDEPTACLHAWLQPLVKVSTSLQPKWRNCPWNWQLLANLSTFKGSNSLWMRRDCNQGSGDSRKISSSCWKSAALVFPPFKLKHHHHAITYHSLVYERLTDLLFFLHANTDSRLFVDLVRTKDIQTTLCVQCLKPFLQMLTKVVSTRATRFSGGPSRFSQTCISIHFQQWKTESKGGQNSA